MYVLSMFGKCIKIHIFFILLLVSNNLFPLEMEFLSPNTHLPRCQISPLESPWTKLSTEEKDALRERIFGIILKQTMKMFLKQYPDIQESDAAPHVKEHIEKRYLDIINFTLYGATQNPSDSSERVDFSEFLRSRKIVADLALQISLLGRIQPGDTFLVSKEMTEREKEKHGETKHIKPINSLDGHMDRLSGNVTKIKRGEKEYLVVTINSLVEESMPPIYFIAPITTELPKPDDRNFVFMQGIPEDYEEIEVLLAGQPRMSFIDILDVYGYKTSVVEYSDFERGSVFIKNDGEFVIDNIQKTFLLLVDVEGNVYSTAVIFGDKEREAEIKVEKINEQIILHHVHPGGDAWLSEADVRGSMAFSLPFAVSTESGEGMYYEPRFSRTEEDDLQRKFDELSKAYTGIRFVFDRTDKEGLTDNMIDQFALAFLSHFYMISEYYVPAAMLESDTGNLQEEELEDQNASV